jgi:hypothetical protein
MYCGEVLKKSWDSCPNCRTTISNSSSQELPKINPFKKQGNAKIHKNSILKSGQINILGYLSLIFAILGLVFGYGLGAFLDQWVGVVLEIVVSIIAMIFGGIPLYKGEINKVALAGLILGGINFILLYYLMPVFWS